MSIRTPHTWTNSTIVLAKLEHLCYNSSGPARALFLAGYLFTMTSDPTSLPPSLPSKRRRGGQPGNINARKRGLTPRPDPRRMTRPPGTLFVLIRFLTPKRIPYPPTERLKSSLRCRVLGFIHANSPRLVDNGSASSLPVVANKGLKPLVGSGGCLGTGSRRYRSGVPADAAGLGSGLSEANFCW